MATTGQDFTMWAGDTVELAFAITDAAGDALDLTGATVRWGLATFAGEALLVEKTTVDAGGVTIDDAEGGEITVTLDPEDTADLGGRPYYVHEVEVTDDAGATTTVAVGRAVIKKAILA